MKKSVFFCAAWIVAYVFLSVFPAAFAAAQNSKPSLLFIGYFNDDEKDRPCALPVEQSESRWRDFLAARVNNFRHLSEDALKRAIGGGRREYTAYVSDNFRLAREVGRKAGAEFVHLIGRYREKTPSGGACHVDFHLIEVRPEGEVFTETAYFSRNNMSADERRQATIRVRRSLFSKKAAGAAFASARPGSSVSDSIKRERELARAEMEKLRAERKKLMEQSKSITSEQAVERRERELVRAEMEKLRAERKKLMEQSKSITSEQTAERRERELVRAEMEKLRAEREKLMEQSKSITSKQTAEAVELAFWDSIKTSKNPEDFGAYLQKYPNGQFASLARIRQRQGNQVVRRGAEAPAASPQAASRPKLYGRAGRYHALVVGINNYKHMKRLQTAVNDAKAVAEVLERDYGFEVDLLLDATRYQILATLSKMRAKLTERDNLLVYYAGHGILDKAANAGYWLPADAEKEITANWIATHDVTNSLRAMSAKHVMVVADSCYSGTLTRSLPAQPRTGRERFAWLKRMAKKRSRTVLTSGGLEPVSDSGGGSHSIFAKSFLTVLRENTWVIEGQDLHNKLKRPVVVNSQQTPEYSDIRNTGHEGGDFLFIRKQ